MNSTQRTFKRKIFFHSKSLTLCLSQCSTYEARGFGHDKGILTLINKTKNVEKSTKMKGKKNLPCNVKEIPLSKHDKGLLNKSYTLKERVV